VFSLSPLYLYLSIQWLLSASKLTSRCRRCAMSREIVQKMKLHSVTAVWCNRLGQLKFVLVASYSLPSPWVRPSPILLELFVSHHTDTLFTSSPLDLALSAIIKNFFLASSGKTPVWYIHSKTTVRYRTTDIVDNQVPNQVIHVKSSR
jgi:hypothetical protein